MAITNAYESGWTWTELESMLKLVGGEVAAFTDADATPSVAGGAIFTTANTGATTITDFDGGLPGQVIFVVLDANTTIDVSGTTLYGNAGVDYVGAANDAMVAFTPDGTDWHCLFINAA